MTIARIPGALSLDIIESMLAHVPDTPFFVKDARLRFVAVNEAMLKLCGVRRRRDLIGKTSRQFFPAPMPERGEAFDREVIESKRPSRERLDVLLARGGPVWLLFRRWPVLGARGEVLGVASIARRLDAPDRRHPTYRRLAAAIDHLQANFREPLRLDRLARRAGVSASQFERDFTALFGVSPRQYQTTVRIEAAMALLAGPLSVAAIAQECGFSDQSAFTRRFAAVVGLTPSQYRRSLKA